MGNATVSDKDRVKGVEKLDSMSGVGLGTDFPFEVKDWEASVLRSSL